MGRAAQQTAVAEALRGPNSLYDALIRPKRGSDHPFLKRPDGAALAYGDMIGRAHRFALALERLGVRPGDRVAAQAPKSPEMLQLYFATIAAGAIFLPLNTAYTPSELAYFLEDAEPTLLVCAPDDAEALESAARAAGARLLTMGAAGAGGLPALAEREDPIEAERYEPIARARDDLAAILYTSGTTGRSKGAMLSHRNLLSNAEALAALWRFGADDTLLHALPIYHTHGLFVATNVTLAAGGAMLFLPSFDVDAVIEALPRATAMMGVPTFYTRLLEHPGLTRAAARHMRLFVSGSAPLLAETHAAFEARTGHRILERYGMTETNMNTSNPYDGERRPGSVGLSLPGVALRVVDAESGAELPDGAVGVIEVKGDNVCRGYWRNPEKTAAEFRADGFFITGDLGRRDPDGYVAIVGRAKDLIISGGLNIYPKEIEEAIDALPGVRESAVIGAPHGDFGEAVVAVIDAEDPALDEQATLAALAERLAGFKRPKRVVFVDALPRNSMGKVQKAALRDTYNALFANGAAGRPAT